MINIKNYLGGKHTNRYIFPILGRHLIKIFTKMINFEPWRCPGVDARAQNYTYETRNGQVIFWKNI